MTPPPPLAELGVIDNEDDAEEKGEDAEAEEEPGPGDAGLLLSSNGRATGKQTGGDATTGIDEDATIARRCCSGM